MNAAVQRVISFAVLDYLVQKKAINVGFDLDPDGQVVGELKAD
jgi:hypothetical protein